jgi:D-beta-D-heptose 7-phosphate kinase/D-beta-D-heptose 1-phosphate adenosyltransferase
MDKIILTTGTFNLCHAGHIRLFEFCSQFGKVVVGINADPYLWEKYGKDRTIPLIDRAYVLKSCKYVDEVIAFTENEPSKLIASVKPDLYVKGPDYNGKEIPEKTILNKLNIMLAIQPADKEYNSSELIQHYFNSSFNKLNKYS